MKPNYYINSYGRLADKSQNCELCDGSGEIHSHNPNCCTCGGSGDKTYWKGDKIPKEGILFLKKNKGHYNYE